MLMYQVACNGCGAGKTLYFKRNNPSMREDDGPVFTWQPFDSIKSKLTIEELSKGCPKCGCKDLDILEIL